MQAIVVRYIPMTNTKPTRLKAQAKAGSITIPYDSLGDDPTRNIAESLAKSFQWEGELIEGTLPNGDSVFVFMPDKSEE